MSDFYGLNMFLAETSATSGGLDSLLDPSGPIKRAQELAARAFGADRTFFVTNGTSTANKPAAAPPEPMEARRCLNPGRGPRRRPNRRLFGSYVIAAHPPEVDLARSCGDPGAPSASSIVRPTYQQAGSHALVGVALLADPADEFRIQRSLPDGGVNFELGRGSVLVHPLVRPGFGGDTRL
jgi:hypothetical protein